MQDGLKALLDILVYEDDTGRLKKTTTGTYCDTSINNWGYRQVSLDRGSKGRVRQVAHRLVWMLHNGAIPDGLMVDHINLDKTDNRIANLRLIHKSGNAQNSKWKGYHLEKRSGKYRAEIKLNGKVTYLGLYNTPAEARTAYLKAKETMHPYASKHVKQ